MSGGACFLGPFPIGSLPVTVPTDYVGMHFRGWPITNPAFQQEVVFPQTVSPSPNAMGFGSTRLHDSGFCNWYQIEATQSVYTWTNLDTIVTAHRQAGRTIIFELLGAPQFYIANADANKLVNDSYAVKGGKCYPGATVAIEGVDGLAGLTNFITALVTRYNAAGGAWRLANPTLGRGLDKIECWNEAFNVGSDFYIGSVAQLVDIAYTIRTAAKSVDASIVVLSPSSNDINLLVDWLGTSGAINTTKKGSDGCDALAVHSYNVMLPYTSMANYTSDCLTGYYKGYFQIRNRLNTLYPTLPVYITESGIGYDFTNPAAGMALAIAATPDWRFKFWARMLMLGAAFGYKCWQTYCWERPFSCNAYADPNGIQKALTTVHTKVGGKTITAASYTVGGEVALTFSDLTTLII